MGVVSSLARVNTTLVCGQVGGVQRALNPASFISQNILTKITCVHKNIGLLNYRDQVLMPNQLTSVERTFPFRRYLE